MLLALAAVALAAGALAAPSLSAGKSVTIGDDYFVRPAGGATVSVNRGQALTWTWKGMHSHSVTVLSGPQKFHSKTQSTGSFTHKFTKAGTYKLYCTVHGTVMSMTVKVK